MPPSELQEKLRRYRHRLESECPHAFYESRPRRSTVDARASLDSNDFPYEVTASGGGGLKAPRETIRDFEARVYEAALHRSWQSTPRRKRENRSNTPSFPDLPQTEEASGRQAKDFGEVDPPRMEVDMVHRRRRRTAHSGMLHDTVGEKRSLHRSMSMGGIEVDNVKRQRRGSEGHAVLWQEWLDEAKENAGWVWSSVSQFGRKLKSRADQLLGEVSRVLDSDNDMSPDTVSARQLRQLKRYHATSVPPRVRRRE